MQSNILERNVKDLVPRFRHPSALSKENHVSIWPFCDHRPCRDDPRGSVFTLEPGWTLLGWCKAPIKSSRDYNDALVLEYDVMAASSNSDSNRSFVCSCRESGIYWIHCHLESMNFKIITQ